MRVVICNTSPLQYLHQVGLLHILPELFGSVQIPLAVVDEIGQGRKYGIDLPDIKQLQWLSVKSVSDYGLLPQIAGFGRGEIEVIALGLESKERILILDDNKARRFALAIGLEIVGTLGLLALAKKRGLVDSVLPILDELQELQFRMSDRIRQAIVTLVDEQDQNY